MREQVYRAELVASLSPKKVLPPFLPELSYCGLAIVEGGALHVQLSRIYVDGAATAAEAQRSCGVVCSTTSWTRARSRW